jgi:phosphoribosylamine--glycine ligase/phosphoribosylformylglycinamidine cyclo-ligase
MNILIIGGGGREHALAWKIAQSPQVSTIYVAPGNGGTTWARADDRASCENIPIPVDDIASLLDFARTLEIDLTVVGPELPLSLGIVDAFRAENLRIFGATRAAAQLETSKAYAKSFMREVGIPTAEYAVFGDDDAAAAFIRDFGRPVVVKADGLAAGKGVIVCDTVEQALDAVDLILNEGTFGGAGAQIIVEERLTGVELSVLAFCDGTHFALMPPARDHKRIFDGDQGANTGGMGAYAPVPDLPPTLLDSVRTNVFQRALDGMAARGTPYTGVLYAGLMLTTDGYRVLEFNARFGDPETQAILPLLDSDLANILCACADGSLNEIDIKWKSGACACVVAAAAGYPGSYAKGMDITGGDDLPSDTIVFHAGTTRVEGHLRTSGGRVLGVSGVGESLAGALDRAYIGIQRIRFGGMHYRRDIGGAHMRMVNSPPLNYASAGVDIDAGNRAVALMKTSVQSTYTPDVLAGIGAFGGMFDGSRLKAMESPVLVASTDGVGTKTMVAARLNRWETIGIDLVNHCINDILVQGARPLFFLDYIASSKLNPEQIAAIVSGMAEACKRADCALLGGETAEMPGVYQPDQIDIAGTIVGVVEHKNIIDGSRIQAGDVVIGLGSSGLHTNGYSLARRVLDDLNWETPMRELGWQTVGDALLSVHHSYLPVIDQLKRDHVDIRGIAHITGGGLIENLPRILPAGLSVTLDPTTWHIPPIFTLIQQRAGIADAEMYRAFNMGIGMIIVISAHDAHRLELKPIGTIIDTPDRAERVIIQGIVV